MKQKIQSQCVDPVYKLLFLRPNHHFVFRPNRALVHRFPYKRRWIKQLAFSTQSSILDNESRSHSKYGRIIPDDGLTFHDFVHQRSPSTEVKQPQQHDHYTSTPSVERNNDSTQENHHQMHTFSIKTYGCQMNVSDTEIVRSVLLATGKFKELLAADPIDDNERGLGNQSSSNRATDNENGFVEPDIILTNTCAIREGAEQKVLTRLQQLRALNRKKGKRVTKTIIGVLGCMAERLKDKLFDDNIADLVVGPDAYRTLPQLLYNLLPPPPSPTPEITSSTYVDPKRRQPPQMNVQLSTDETYADIIPIRQPDHESDSNNAVSAFVSIQRGCNNRCSFCIVPFTRGIERSRPLQSIVDEIKRLHFDDGVKEVTLLGQNVNSYQDQSICTVDTGGSSSSPKVVTSYQMSNPGFKSRIQRADAGYFFADLLEAVSDIHPQQLRVRYTSPHPKDFPAPLLQLMSERPNICNHLHMPAQSGSSTVLKRMKRGYTREAYLQLIDDVRATIPDVAISSDFIAGFCNETDEEHDDTISLLQHVKYDQAFMFAYSRRDGTHAARTMDDNVPENVKQRRLREIIDTYQDLIQTKNKNEEIGRFRLVLVEGEATKRSRDGDRSVIWKGRTDQNKRILFSLGDMMVEKEDNLGISCWNESDIHTLVHRQSPVSNHNDNFITATTIPKTGNLCVGDYAVVQVMEAKGHTLRGKLCWKSDSITSFEPTFALLQSNDNNQLREATLKAILS